MHRRQPPRLLVLLFAVIVASTVSQPFALAESTSGTGGIDRSMMDRSVDPGEDFYRYANGRWLDTTELPDGEYRYGVFNENGDAVNDILLDALLGFEPDDTTDEGKARAFYDQIVDEDARDDLGLEPIQPALDQIMEISSIEEGLEFQSIAYTYRLQGLFYPTASPNPEDATEMVGYITDSDLSLPSFWDYLDHSAEGDELREEWVDSTAALLQELGYSRREAREAAETVLAFETAMAEAMWFIPAGDTHKWNHHYTLAELQEVSPAIDWQAYVENSALPDDLEVLYAYDPIYLQKLATVLEEADPLALQYLFATQLAWLSANYLTMDTFDIAQDFEWRVERGLDEGPGLEQYALEATIQNFPDVFGRIYVEEAFSPEQKAEVEALVQHVIDAFRVRIEQNEWMSDDTKEMAIEKLDLMTVNVGYPEEWDSYDTVVVGDSAWETRLSVHELTMAGDVELVGQDVDYANWSDPAYEVNASYWAAANSITIPAGILRAPFYDPTASLAVNYGGIGAVIGHEITHAFDDDGAEFDGHGNLVFWWDQADYDAFSELSAEVSHQYASLELSSGLTIDGDLTLGENIADMGGVQVSYDGLEMALEDAGTPIQRSDQREFFLAWAQLWRSISTPEYEEWLVQNDPHCPGEVRAVEPLRHMEEFYEAFGITRTDDEWLAPRDRIVIW